MEQKLKQQRNRLCCRITLILMAVWLMVSAAYFAVCIRSEKNSVQNRELANISYAKHQLSQAVDMYDLNSRIYLNIIDLIYFDNSDERDWNSQIIVIDEKKHETVLNTSAKIVAKFGVKIGVETSSYGYGFLDYYTFRNSLSDEQFQTIKSWLNTPTDDGKSYELICTEFQVVNSEYIPLELKVALTQGEDTWFIADEIADTFSLSDNMVEGEQIFFCNDMRRNIVPKKFLLDEVYNNDYINLLTEEQREKAVETISIGTFEYVFYASDYLYLSEDAFYDDEIQNDSVNGTSYVIQFAKRIDLLNNCKTKLLIGTSVIFLFFFAIAFILCLMIWNIVKVQILQEQKRREITNALAHDIKTPLFVISGYAYSLKENIDIGERDAYLEKIIEQTDEINSLVHKMLNLSKLDSYTMTLSRTDFDLYDLSEETLEKYTVLPEGKSFELTRAGNNIVNADRELIRTVLQNLTDNAVKYSLPDSVIQVSVTDNTIRIANRSQPLDKTDIKQLWQPYIRKDKSRHRNGNGLGLSIVKSILDLHGTRYNITYKDKMFIFHAEFRKP